MKEFWKEEGWIGVDSISQGVVFNDAQGHATVIAYTPSSSWLEIDGFVAKDHAKTSGRTVYIYGAGIMFYPSFQCPDDMNIEAFVHPDGSYTADKGFIGLVKAADPCFDNE